jgi:glucan phosphoethanolaminetransferase (alkaline phosphatase superfamily)
MFPYRIVALGALLWAPTIWMLVWASAHYPLRSVIAIALTAVLVGFVASGLARTWRRLYLLLFPFFLLSVGFLAYTLAFRMPPGHTLSLILVAASGEELRGFLGITTQGRQLALLLSACTAGYLYLAAGLQSTPIFVGRAKPVSRAIVALMLPLTVYSAWDAGELIDGIGLNPIVGSLMFLGGTLPDAAAEIHGSRVVKLPYHASRVGAEEVHVMIVGESARRASWSVYGYSRPTTPYLNSLRSEAIFFGNAISDANLTEWAVPMLLTGMTPETLIVEKIRGNIFDLAREGGYSTAWLVNQDVGISNTVGVTADRLENPIDVNATIDGRRTHDDVLLPAYERELAHGGAARFIGIHMMGSHWEYSRRYPAAFRRFGSGKDLGLFAIFLDGEANNAAVVDEYDNTVLYTDWFLQQIIERARSLKVPATVTFFPDHGEDLQLFDGQSGHGAPMYTAHAFEIPAFIWVNDAYRTAHPTQVEALRANASKEVRSHDVFYTVADLMGITWPGNVAMRSIASKDFSPDVNMKHLAGGVLVARY